MTRCVLFVLALLVLLSPAPPGHAVEVKRVVSPGGIEAWLVEDHTNPILSLELAFRGGSALDPADKNGLARMVASTIDEGAGSYDSLAYQGRLDDLAIRLRFSARIDTFRGSLQTLTSTREEAFEMLRLALTEPRFDEEPVERVRSQILASLAEDMEEPRVISGRALWRLLYPNHPYGEPSDGTRAGVKAITEDDLRSFVAERFQQDRLMIGVAGDVTPKELGRLLDETFLSLDAEGAPLDVSEAQVQNTGETVVIERDIPQSVISLGHGGIRRDDPDFYAAYVVNHILGGGSFSSRLFREVREKRGLAYSVSSYLLTLDHGALVVGGVATQNARAGISLDLIREEWARMAREGPTKQELEDAKRYLTGSFPLRLSSSDAIAEMLLGMQIDDLGLDYLDRRNSYIEAVTLEQAKRVAGELYSAGKLNAVAVGQPEGIEPSRSAPDNSG